MRKLSFFIQELGYNLCCFVTRLKAAGKMSRIMLLAFWILLFSMLAPLSYNLWDTTKCLFATAV